MFWRIESLETKHHSLLHLKSPSPVTSLDYFDLTKSGLNALIQRNLMAKGMKHQIMHDGVLQRCHHKHCMLQFRSSVHEVKSLCETHDLVFLQETWLMPHNPYTLHSIHDSFAFSNCTLHAFHVYFPHLLQKTEKYRMKWSL